MIKFISPQILMVLHLSWVAAHQCLKGRGPIPIQFLTLQIMGQLIDQLCCFVCIFSFKLLLLCILLLCKIGIDWVNMQRTSIQYWQMTNSHGGDLHCKTQIQVCLNILCVALAMGYKTTSTSFNNFICSERLPRPRSNPDLVLAWQYLVSISGLKKLAK